jgi:hypothetical protein
MGSFRGVTMVSHAPVHPTGTLDLFGGGAGKALGGVPELGKVNIPPPEAGGAAAKPLEQTLEESGLKKAAAATEAIEKEALVPSIEAGSVAELVLSESLNLALALVTLIATAVWELIIAPKINLLMAQLQAQRAKEIKEQIQKKFETWESQHINRIIKYCYLYQLEDYEKKGKRAHVNVQLRVSFEDISGRILNLSDKPPESIFDIRLNDVELGPVSLSESPAKASVTPLKRCDNCGTGGRGRTFVTNNPLYEQTVTFSFEAPKAVRVRKEFEAQFGKEAKPTTEDCLTAQACFIATVCYGSPSAPAVVTLRRFRDRYLVRTLVGRWLIELYYRFSPWVATWLWYRPEARDRVRRVVVAPAAAVVRLLFFAGREFKGVELTSAPSPQRKSLAETPTPHLEHARSYDFSRIRVHHVSEAEAKGPRFSNDRGRP